MSNVYKNIRRTLKTSFFVVLSPLLFTFVLLLYFLGFKVQKIIAKTISYVIFIFNKKNRGRAYKNIHLSLDSSINAEEIYKSSLYKQVLNTIEFIFIMTKLYGKKRLKNNCIITGLDKLLYYLKSKKNVIAISSHTGNFPLMCACLALMEVPVAVIYKETTYFGKNSFGKRMQYYGIETIKYIKNDIYLTRKIINFIKNKKLVFFIIDQKGVNKIKVIFFGNEVYIFPGASVIAKRLHATVFPIFTHRVNNKHEINILEPFELDNVSIENGIQKMIKEIEDYIKLYPDEWNWAYYKW